VALLATPPGPPVLVTPRAFEVSFGRISGRVSPAATSLVVAVDGRVVARKELRGRRGFDFHVELPPRDVRVTVTAVFARGRRGTSVGPVFGLPRSAEPRAPPRRGVEDARLARELRALAAGYGGTCAIFVQDLRSGRGAAWNARAEFPAASTLKVAIAVEVLRALRGPPPPGSRLDRMLRSMIVPSEDRPANDLLTWLGGSTSGGSAKVNATFRALGLADTNMYGGYIVPSAEPIPLRTERQPGFVGKRTSAWDFARLLGYVHQAAAGRGKLARRGGFVPSEARYLLYLLAHTRPGYLDRYLGGREVTILSKPGWITRVRHDGGLAFWSGGSFVAVVLTYDPRGAGVSEENLAGRVARAAFARFYALRDGAGEGAGADARADPRAVPRAAGDERAAQPRPAHLLRARQAVVPDGAARPPRGRAVRALVRGRGRRPGDARRGRPGALLPAAVRRPPRLARRSARPRSLLGRAGRDRRGRLRGGGSAEARRGSAPPPDRWIAGGTA
jgi:hypothetical protein